MVSFGSHPLLDGLNAVWTRARPRYSHSSLSKGGVDRAGNSLLWLSAAATSSDSVGGDALVCYGVPNPSALKSGKLSASWFGRPYSSTTAIHSKDAGQETFIHEGSQAESRELDATSVPETDEGSSSSPASILTFLCPLLKLLGGNDPAASRNVFLETATSGVASMARLPWGSKAIPEAAAVRAAMGQPPKLFQLYEFEACPFCRRVREALTELDLSAEVYPCPKGSVKHRAFVRQVGGKDQFPFFIDPNTGANLYESSDIVKYLFKEYGEGKGPSPWLLESTIVSGWMPTILRAGRGMMRYPKSKLDIPDKKLELYSYENNQFARLVREALCELELPYILKNVAKGSSGRVALLGMTGSSKVPYLVDPNTGATLTESQNIIAYLFSTYSTSDSQPVSA